MSNNSFKIIVPFYNVEEWIDKCVKSIKLQTFEDFECYLIDDISTDNSSNIIKDLIKGDNRFKLITNKEKRFALENIYLAIQQSGDNPEDIIVTLDGDDWFASKKVLETLDEKYNKHRCFITYGSYIEYPSKIKGKFCKPISNEVIKNNSFRDSQWFSSHLRTFKRHLWDSIKIEDLKDNGKFYRMTWDMAFMFPMLEMAGPMSLHIPQILYCYNRQNPLNDDKVNHRLQLETERQIRSKKRYNKNFVSSQILGPSGDINGIGNQLFCVATAISYSIKNNKQSFFPQISTDRHIKKFKDTFYKKLNVGRGGDFFHQVFYERGFEFNEIKNFDGNTKIHGYFQSEKYFSEHRNEVLDLLNIKELKDTIKLKYKDYQNYTSIHVRRGDYLILKDYHHNLSIEYYKKTAQFFPKDEKFVVFSNDIPWCKENFDFLENVEFSEGKEEWEDMISMSLCKNNIIANSSFSWWGAWLNTNENKKVIAPKKWFGPKYQNKDTKDVIPKSWVTIDV